MTEPTSVVSAVEAAFEAEEQATETTEQATETATEQPAQAQQPTEAVEQAPAQEAPAENTEQAAQTEAQAEQPEQATPPQQLKGDFAREKWNGLDKDTKDELSRLCAENERNYKRAAEAEYNARSYRKTIEPVQGYISEVAESGKISEAEVVRNCVSMIQNLNDNPDLTAQQMIAADIIRFTDPVSVINIIAHKYGLDLKGELTPSNIPPQMQADAARAKYEARQSKYVKPQDVEAERESAISEYVESVPSIKALLDNANVKDRFIRQISMERSADPYASDITIINRAAELFQQQSAPVQQQPQEAKPTLAETKLNKVVTPKASSPAEVAADRKPEEWTPENVSAKSREAAERSVRAAMRSMGLDD